jgi:ketosteroid isomerase-like protein
VNRLESFAEAWLRDWNSHDLEVILSHYAEDVVFRSPKVARFTDSDVDTLKGRDALRPYFARGLATRPQLRFELVVATVDRDGVAIVYTAEDGGTAVETMSINREGEVAEARVFYNPPIA